MHWNDVSGETGFVVQRSTNNADWSIVGNPSGQTTYTDGTSEATSYYYRVAAVDGSGTGDYSASINVLTKPTAPTGFAANPVSATEVDLSWTNVSTGATSNKVYRQGPSGGPVLLATLAASAASYQDLAAASGTAYTYSVVAYNAAGPSTSTSQSVLTVPAQPQNLTPVAANSTEIDLSWSAVTGATAYTLQRSTDQQNWTTAARLDNTHLSFNDTNLSDGTLYYYTLTASNQTGAGQAASAHATTLPAAVGLFHANSSSPTEVDLSWNVVSRATAYHLYRSADNGQTFALLTTIADPAVQAYVDTVSEGSAYTYRIAPVDASGEGAVSEASITTIPAAPTNYVVTALSATSVHLTWVNASAHNTGFTVRRQTNGQFTWTTLTSSLASNATSFTDTTTDGGMIYFYELTATGPGGRSYINAVGARTMPNAVTTLTATSASTNEIDLAWTAVNGVDTYTISRSTDGVHFNVVDSVDGSTSTYHDTNQGNGLTEGTAYSYQITAQNLSGTSAPGNIQSVTTLAAAPSGLATSVASNHEIDLAWTNHSANASEVAIERSTNNSTWSLLNTVASSVSNYQDQSVVGGTTYYYRLSAVDAAGANYMSDHASVSALSLPDAPAASAVPQTSGAVAVSWNAVTGAATYNVKRSTDNQNWTVIDSLVSSTSVTDTGLTGNTTYYYQVQAVNGTGVGSYSASASALTVPAAPTNLVPTSVSDTEIDLNWSGTAGVTFAIYRAVGGSATFAPLNTVSGVTTYADTGLTAGQTYAYEVFATNASGQNPTPASTGQTTPLPAIPANITPVQITDVDVYLSWNASAGATSYTVSRQPFGGSYTQLTVSPLNASTLTYHDGAAAAGTTYTYKITAINAVGSQYGTLGVTTLPAIVTGLTANVVDNHHIALGWTAVTGATSYTLQRSPNGFTNWTNVPVVSGTSVTDTVAGGGTYSYRVAAVDITGSGGWSDVSAPLTTVPDAPTGITATATSDTAVHLTWPLVSGALNYLVQRSDNGGSTWSDPSGILASNVTSYSDTGLTELTAYQYQVIASNAVGPSVPSAVASVVTKPTAPSDLQTTSVGSTEVDLAWTDHSNGLAGFDVQRSDISGSSWATIGTTLASVTSYADTSASAATRYLYRVIADNGSVVSSPTAPFAVLTTPAAPANVVATPVGTAQVQLAWNASTGASTYTILRSENAGNFHSIATGLASTTYNDNTVSGGITYAYEILAVNATGAGPAGVSNFATTIPIAQGDFSAVPFTATQVNLAWSLVPGATSYTIERSTNGVDFTTLTTPALGQMVHSYQDTTAQPGTNYVYRIHGTDSTGDSATTTAEALTVPAAVGGLTPSVISDSEIDLSWTADAGTVTGYRVLVSTGGAFSPVGSDLGSGVSSLPVTGLANATAYTFEVLALNASGVSGASMTNVVTTTPAAPTALQATGVSASEIDLGWTDSPAQPAIKSSVRPMASMAGSRSAAASPPMPSAIQTPD